MRAPARVELNCQIIMNIYFRVDKSIFICYNTIKDKERRINKMYAIAGIVLLGFYIAVGLIAAGFIGIIVAVIVTSIIGIIEDKERR